MVNVSGGADSAILLWQLLKYLRLHKRILENITVISGVESSRVHNEWNAREVFLAISEKFTEQTFVHDVFYYDKIGSKLDYHIAHEKELQTQGILCMFHGRTANPPKQIQELIKYNDTTMYADRSKPAERDVTEKKRKTEFWWDNNTFTSVPFDNVDKKFLAGLYKKEPYMMNVVYPLTASCISNKSIDTKWFQEPCRKCFWCQERYWAFGSYDGGIQ